MRMIRVLLLSLLSLGIGADAVAKDQAPAKAAAGKRFGAAPASVNGGTFQAKRIGMTFNQDDSFSIVLQYTNAGSGKNVVTRIITIPADHSQPIKDQNGTQVAATTPGPMATAIDSFLAQVDSLMTSGASGGKLDL
jgi:hypothetical protein